MSFSSQLQASSNRVAELYAHNVGVVHELQGMLVREILPSMRDELELDDETENWAREWLEDTVTVFQICRRHEFTRSFAMEAIRKNLVWRVGNMSLLIGEHQGLSRTIFCLPDHCRDPFGRPIVVVRATPVAKEANGAVAQSPDDFRAALILTLDRLRIHLRDVNNDSGTRDGKDVVMQYVVLLDLEGVSIKAINIDLITWSLKEVIPKFPSIFAAVFLVNYSWTHSSVWTVVSHLLPASALARIFFPSRTELIQYFGSKSLPKEYGGSLPPLMKIPDPLRPPTLPLGTDQNDIVVSRRPSSSKKISRTSDLNPYFGYPTLSKNSTYSSRRTKWYLARTLAYLLWEKWGSRIKLVLCMVVFLMVMRRIRRRLVRVSMDLFRRVLRSSAEV